MPKPKFLVVYCYPGGPNGGITGEFHNSVVQMYEARIAGTFKYNFKLLSAETGPLIATARNKLAREFLDGYPGYTHMLSVDSDMSFNTEDIEALLKADKPIVGGVYFGKSGQAYFPVAMKRQEDKHYRPLDKSQVPGPGETVEVDAVGMGLTLIKREVVEALNPAPTSLWPFAETIVEGVAVGEDVTFCRRAKGLGYQTWLCGDARAGHVKTVVLGG